MNYISIDGIYLYIIYMFSATEGKEGRRDSALEEYIIKLIISTNSVISESFNYEIYEYT